MNDNDITPSIGVCTFTKDDRRPVHIAFCDACDQGAGFDSLEKACAWLDRHELGQGA